MIYFPNSIIYIPKLYYSSIITKPIILSDRLILKGAQWKILTIAQNSSPEHIFSQVNICKADMIQNLCKMFQIFIFNIIYDF